MNPVWRNLHQTFLFSPLTSTAVFQHHLSIRAGSSIRCPNVTIAPASASLQSLYVQHTSVPEYQGWYNYISLQCCQMGFESHRGEVINNTSQSMLLLDLSVKWSQFSWDTLLQLVRCGIWCLIVGTKTGAISSVTSLSIAM